MLELKHVTKEYRKKAVVSDLNLLIKEGDVVCLKGVNGAGKSTTIAMMAGIRKPEQGEILFQGKDIFKQLGYYRKQIGYVPQQAALYEELSGKDNLLYWGRLSGLKKSEVSEQIGTMQEFIGFSTQDMNKKVCEYSGGMRQKINIAVALLHQPKLLLMDEPTAGIDKDARAALSGMLKKLNQQGTAIVYTGHYDDELDVLGGQTVVIG